MEMDRAARAAPDAVALTAEQYLAAVIESSDDAIVASDRRRAVTLWNPAAEQMLGYTTAEVLGLDTLALFAPDAREAEAAALDRVWQGETKTHYETTMLGKDGARIEVSVTVSPIRAADGTIVGASKIIRDIRERRQAQIGLQRLAALVDSSEDAIVGKDLDGIVTSWNASAERMFGFTAKEMIGRSITTIIPRDRLSEEDYVLGRIRAGLRVEHFETVRQHKNGDLIRHLAHGLADSRRQRKTGGSVEDRARHRRAQTPLRGPPARRGRAP